MNCCGSGHKRGRDKKRVRTGRVRGERSRPVSKNRTGLIPQGSVKDASQVGAREEKQLKKGKGKGRKKRLQGSG